MQTHVGYMQCVVVVFSCEKNDRARVACHSIFASFSMIWNLFVRLLQEFLKLFQHVVLTLITYFQRVLQFLSCPGCPLQPHV